MKKLFTAILAISALVACNRDYVVESLNQSVITFDDSFVEIKTRAAEDPSTTTASIDAFDVWGYMGSEAGVVFEQERVSKTDAGWTYANLKYWMPEQNYYFAAVSPVDDANIKINTEDRSFNAPTGLGVIEFTNEYGTTDLLYAEKSLTTDADATNEDKVHLQFAHMLSKVKFTFVNALPNEIQIKNIKINNAPKSASIDMTADARAWADHAGEVALNFGDVEKGAMLAISGDKHESDYARLTLPVGGEYEYNITFDVYVYHGTEAGHIAHSTTLTGAEFMIGKAYNLTAIISPENLGLQPIEFTVAVDEWVDGGEYDIYAPEGDDDEPETPVVPEEPEVKETKLYLQPNANWNMDNARFAAYMWNNSGDVWFDMTLVEGETNIYEFTLPEGYSNIIFCRMNPGVAANNWNNKWNQTGDLVVPADGMNLFVVPENAWDGATTGWTTYTPATTPEEPADVINVEILNVTTGYDQPGEKELQFWYSPNEAHVIDFKGMDSCVPGEPLAAGFYSSDNDTIDLTYSLYGYGVVNESMSFAECTVTDNGSGSYTYDAKFTYNGQEYAFVYTSPVEESGNTVQLVSTSVGEQIGSYAYGCLLSDAEGNNQVKIAVDEYYSWDSALDFPKANDYTTFQSSPSYIMNGSHFSFVNKTLKVNGVTYANSEVSNAKLTVVEATSITVEFTVDGEDYKFVYSI